MDGYSRIWDDWLADDDPLLIFAAKGIREIEKYLAKHLAFVRYLEARDA